MNWILTILGVLLLGYGGFEALESYQASTSWETAEARITHLEQVRGRRGRVSYKPHFSFQAASGGSYHGSGSAIFSGRSYSRGERVQVRYPADAPEKAKLDSVMEMWLFPGILLGIGVFLIAAGALALRRKKEEEEARPDEKAAADKE